VRVRLTRLIGSLAEHAGRRVKAVPGVAAAACGVTGTCLLWGAGWAWLCASGFLLVLAREVN
jgi:hypothetical protein